MLNFLVKLQDLLYARNEENHNETMMHLLATYQDNENFVQQVLAKFLSPDNLQRCNLGALSRDGKSPISAAIADCKITFLKQVFESETALNTPWSTLINTKQVELMKAINKAFELSRMTAYA